jgi:hypothetical protein
MKSVDAATMNDDIGLTVKELRLGLLPLNGLAYGHLPFCIDYRVIIN